MKTFFKLILVIIIIAFIAFIAYKRWSKDNSPALPTVDYKSSEAVFSENFSSLEQNIISDNKISNMKITSSAFENNQYIPPKYTCDGDNKNPPLSISDIPKEAKSLVLIVDDPDATNGDWIHWTVFNISPDTKEISEDSVPQGAVEGRTNFKKPGYGGPCPPSGIHHYQFKLYALDATLSLDATAGKKDIEQAMSGRIIAQDLLVGLYERK